MLADILRKSALRHKHVCPRQVLGARMGLFAGELLQLDLPRNDKRLLAIAEIDGCTLDGLIAATGCHVGGRTLRILDFGKVAATFSDTHTDASIRIAVSPQARSLAWTYAPDARNRWQAMLLGYQLMPMQELFVAQRVRLNTPLSELLGRAGKKTHCENCGEEIVNGRELLSENGVLCRGCAGQGYYHFLLPSQTFQQASESEAQMSVRSYAQESKIETPRKL